MEFGKETSEDIRIVLKNCTKKEVSLVLEPWGEEYPMELEKDYLVIGRGPQVGRGLTIEYLDDAIVITGWTGSVIQVFTEGREVGSVSFRPPVPDFH